MMVALLCDSFDEPGRGKTPLTRGQKRTADVYLRCVELAITALRGTAKETSAACVAEYADELYAALPIAGDEDDHGYDGHSVVPVEWRHIAVSRDGDGSTAVYQDGDVVAPRISTAEFEKRLRDLLFTGTTPTTTEEGSVDRALRQQDETAERGFGPHRADEGC